LRNRRFAEHKFRRQQPVGPFILDFYCHDARLAIEIDGPIHAKQSSTDRTRQSALESLDIRFLRIPAELVEANLDAALNETPPSAISPRPPSAAAEERSRG